MVFFFLSFSLRIPATIVCVIYPDVVEKVSRVHFPGGMCSYRSILYRKYQPVLITRLHTFFADLISELPILWLFQQEIKDLWHIWFISSVYLSISFAKIGLKCTENRPQMYGLASNVQNRPQMYRSASNVQRIGLKCTAVYLSIYLSALLK